MIPLSQLVRSSRYVSNRALCAFVLKFQIYTSLFYSNILDSLEYDRFYMRNAVTYKNEKELLIKIAIQNAVTKN